MKKIIAILLILIGVTLSISAAYFWLDSTVPNELMTLLVFAGVIFSFLIALGANIKGWTDLLNGKGINDSRNKVGMSDEFQKYRISSSPIALSVYQLPSPPSDFVGRLDVKKKLTQAAKKTNVLGLFGMGGIGKTSLGLKVAEELSLEYPDAQLFLDLHGYDFYRKLEYSAADIMAYVIHSLEPSHPIFLSENSELENKNGLVSRIQIIIESFLGISGGGKETRKIDDLYISGKLGAVYRSLLHEKRVLIFLDNVISSEQIISVTPPKESVLIITSRHQIVLPGLASFNLESLSRRDSVRLIRGIHEMSHKQAEALAEKCSYLPLAMRVAAGILQVRSDWTPESLIDGLQNETLDLDQVNTSIQLSYDLLTDKLKYRFLALSDLVAFDANAVEQLWRWGDAPKFLVFLVSLSRQTRFEGAVALSYFYAFFSLYIYVLFQFSGWIYYGLQLTPLLFIYAVSHRLSQYSPPPIPMVDVDESLGLLLNANILIFDKDNNNYKLHDLIRAFARNLTSRRVRLNARKRRFQF